MRNDKPTAVIDIGSNSVRLVVYSGARRLPAPIFNEKVLAGLGKGVARTGEISRDSWECAVGALRRFKLLLRHMGVRRLKVVATAAVRDARNGPEFVHAIERIGFDCRVISAEEEAWLAGEGVLSAIPDADGIVGDLGGGSLELVEVRDGLAERGISVPLGVLRMNTGADGEKAAAETIASALKKSGLEGRGEGRTFYMVGGSWRALAKMDMLSSDYPLPITHGYSMAPQRVAQLRRIAAAPDPRWARKVAAARAESAPVAAMLLSLLVRQLRPRQLVVSAFGIREGLLHSAVPETVRRKDPLIEAARDAGGAERRFGEHGDTLSSWIEPLFDDAPDAVRIRRAACLLADVAWKASPDFRADRGVEMALHGNWVGVSAAERVMLAQALSSSFGRDKLLEERVIRLCTAEQLRRARHWGLAMRLGQRLSAGVGSVLELTELSLGNGRIQLRLPAAQGALVAGPVSRRLEKLAGALGCGWEVVLG